MWLKVLGELMMMNLKEKIEAKIDKLLSVGYKVRYVRNESNRIIGLNIGMIDVKAFYTYQYLEVRIMGKEVKTLKQEEIQKLYNKLNAEYVDQLLKSKVKEEDEIHNYLDGDLV